MIQELYKNALNIYETYRGNGKLLVLFLVALLFLLMFRGDFAKNPIPVIVSPLATVATAVSKLTSMVKEKLGLVFVVFICGFVLITSGERIYSQNHLTKAENYMHIPDETKDVMDYLLSEAYAPKVLAMPDESMYYSMYSSRFDLLFEQRKNEDVRYLSEDARNAYTELSKREPDMKIVSDAASSFGCDYIILANRYYWPLIPLSEYDYELSCTISGWDVYTRKGAE